MSLLNCIAFDRFGWPEQSLGRPEPEGPLTGERATKALERELARLVGAKAKLTAENESLVSALGGDSPGSLRHE